jgi:hypothetical protein
VSADVHPSVECGEPHYVLVDEPDVGAFTLGQFLLVNQDWPPPLDEILMMELLEVGDAITFGGGACGDTKIRRIR